MFKGQDDIGDLPLPTEGVEPMLDRERRPVPDPAEIGVDDNPLPSFHFPSLDGRG
ncbi:MAG: hypothetical protein ABID40_01245 [Candidatus Bipolaricaulota bacterium]